MRTLQFGFVCKANPSFPPLLFAASLRTLDIIGNDDRPWGHVENISNIKFGYPYLRIFEICFKRANSYELLLPDLPSITHLTLSLDRTAVNLQNLQNPTHLTVNYTAISTLPTSVEFLKLSEMPRSFSLNSLLCNASNLSTFIINSSRTVIDLEDDYFSNIQTLELSNCRILSSTKPEQGSPSNRKIIRKWNVIQYRV